MRNLLCFCITAFLLFLWACGKKTQSTASAEIINGIEFVHNTKTPLHPKKSLILEEDLSIEGEDDQGNIVLFRPSRFIVDHEENLYITDSQDQVIKVFDPNGCFKQTIGAKGEGPGEFMSVGDQSFLPDGRLLVMDSRARRTSLFDPSGQFIESYKWLSRLSRLFFATNTSYVVSEYIYEGDNPLEGRRLCIKEYDFEGKEIRSFGEFKEREWKIHRERNIAFGLSIPHSPQSIFAVDHKRQILYHCLNDDYVIDVYDKTGNIFRRIDRPYVPLPFASEDAEEFRSRYERSRNQEMKKLAMSMPMPSVKTVTEWMRVDELGNLWVGLHEEIKEGNRTLKAYDIFNPDGYYEAKIWLDERPYLFAKGKMYRMETDEETGFRILKRYRVIWRDRE
jgi:hypothetical protein